MSLFSKPKAPPPPPAPPTKADASVIDAGLRAPNYSTYIGTGSASGLKRKASTSKPTLIGGA